MPSRSYLFVPGDRTDMLSKAGTRGADAVIGDLEDSVASTHKTDARDRVEGWLSTITDRTLEVWVRVNNTETLLEPDLRAVMRENLTGVVIPKVRGVPEMIDISRLVDKLEKELGLLPHSVALLPIIETARGLLALNQLAMTPRVYRLMIGEFDLGAELGVDPHDSTLLAPLRLQLVVASVAAGLVPPLGPVSSDYRDLETFAEGTGQLARQGFGGRPVIHPAQIPIVNDAFTPTAAEVIAAQRTIQLYEEALDAGRGTAVDDEGKMIDEALIRSARRVVNEANEMPNIAS